MKRNNQLKQLQTMIQKINNTLYIRIFHLEEGSTKLNNIHSKHQKNSMDIQTFPINTNTNNNTQPYATITLMPSTNNFKSINYFCIDYYFIIIYFKLFHMKLMLKTLLRIALFFPFSLLATESLSHKVADLSEDLKALNKEVAQLRLDMELILKENQTLKQQLGRLSSTEDQLKKQTAQLTALNLTFENYKKSLLNEVSHEMDQLSKQTQNAIDQLAKSIVSNSETPKDSFKFTDDYGKEGIAYTVKAGETLSVIAAKQGSTTRDIQNANRISDPRGLKAGQIIFIPTKKAN